jgi:integrase
MARHSYKTKLEKVVNEKYDLLYETSYEDCEKWFRILNNVFFNKELPLPTRFEIGRRRKTWGLYECIIDDNNPHLSESVIKMNHRYKSKKFFVEVLAHEMVHHWQYVSGNPVNHGSTFGEWSARLEKKGIKT